MKKTIQITAAVVAAFLLSWLLRASLHRFAPGWYAYAYGSASTAAKDKLAEDHKGVGPQVPKDGPESREKPQMTAEPLKPAEPTLYATGVLRTTDRVILVMSDGSVRTELDNTPGQTPRLTRATRHYADFDGVRYWIRPREVSEAPRPLEMPKDQTTGGGAAAPGV